VAERVVFHIGTPKTGTTYLQTLVWRHRKALRKQGLLFPGDQRADHLWGSMVVREDPHVERRNPSAPGAWNRLTAQAAAWPRTVLISHEFFGAATPRQAERALVDLAPARVELVVTVRDAVSAVCSMWSQSMKFRHTKPLRDFAPDDSDEDPLNVWGWRTLDAAQVLERWAGDLEPSRVHVIPMPGKAAPSDELWRRFATVLQIDPDTVDTLDAKPNDSLGLVETELLRLLNSRLSKEPMTASQAGRWVRSYLAHTVLVPHGNERFAPPPERLADLRKRADRILAHLSGAGYRIVGDLGDLEPSSDYATRRTPEQVTAEELLEAATDTIATLFADVRRLKAARSKSESTAERVADDVDDEL
jgi:hypothetical protein